MNTSFKVVDDKIVVTDEKMKKHTRDISDNIEEILITENNIEEIKKLISNERKKINKSNFDIKHAKHKFFLAILWFTNFILNITVQNWFAAGCHFLCTTCWISNYLTTFLPEKKQIKRSEKKLALLEENLILENNKLNELNKNKSNDAMCICPDKKTLSTSIQIKILKDRLKDIEFYIKYKNKIIKLYKKGILEGELFEGCASRDTINFIIKLVENDLAKENTNTKTKQKSLNK